MLQLDEVKDSGAFPTDVDVVVVGAGIVGTSTAYELSRKGVSVALLEKGYVGAEQSGRNWGWVRQQNRHHNELLLAMQSLRRWSELGDEIGRDLGFRRNGIMYASVDRDDVERWRAWGIDARQYGFKSDMLSGAEVASRLRSASVKWVGGVWSGSDGLAEPAKAAPAIAEGAKRNGVFVHQSCAVRGFDIAAGRIAGVWTERGRIRASTVVCAAGAWSARLLRQYGVSLPAVNVVGTAMRTAPAPELFQGCLSGPGFALRRRGDGGYTLALPGHGRIELAPQNMRNAMKFYALFRSNLNKKVKVTVSKSFFRGPEASGGWRMDGISPFEQTRVSDPEPNREWMQTAMDNVTKIFPELRNVQVAQTWGGVIDTMPDLVPVISRVDVLPGLIVASGFSGHGFGLGPGAGLLVSELVTNATPFVDVGPFGLGRFFDGSEIKPPEMM